MYRAYSSRGRRDVYRPEGWHPFETAHSTPTVWRARSNGSAITYHSRRRSVGKSCSIVNIIFRAGISRTTSTSRSFSSASWTRRFGPNVWFPSIDRFSNPSATGRWNANEIFRLSNAIAECQIESQRCRYIWSVRFGFRLLEQHSPCTIGVNRWNQNKSVINKTDFTFLSLRARLFSLVL